MLEGKSLASAAVCETTVRSAKQRRSRNAVERRPIDGAVIDQSSTDSSCKRPGSAWRQRRAGECGVGSAASGRFVGRRDVPQWCYSASLAHYQSDTAQARIRSHRPRGPSCDQAVGGAALGGGNGLPQDACYELYPFRSGVRCFGTRTEEPVGVTSLVDCLTWVAGLTGNSCEAACARLARREDSRGTSPDACGLVTRTRVRSVGRALNCRGVFTMTSGRFRHCSVP